MQNKKILSTFPNISQEEWTNKVLKDLKGKSLEEYEWSVNEGLTFSPLYFPSDLKNFDTVTTPSAKKANDWIISELILVENKFEKAHENAMTALKTGSESLEFVLDQALTDAEMEALLAGIQTDILYNCFSGKWADSAPLDILTLFYADALKKNIDPKTLNLSIKTNYIDSALLNYVQEKLPQTKLFQITATQENPVEAIAYILETVQLLLQKWTHLGIDASYIFAHLKINIHIYNYYFVEIAKLRALSLCWASLLEKNRLENQLPFVHTYTTLHTEDTHLNAIASATQAMSAVIGRTDILTVLSANKDPNDDFSRRIAKNVQHILKYESYLDRVQDPAAGTYYIEAMTEKIARMAWNLAEGSPK